MLARELISLHEAPREAPLFSESYPQLSAAAGYEAARALHEHRVAWGWRAGERKMGFTNRTIGPRYGVYEPIWGTVYDRTLIRAVDNHARVPLQGLVNPRIEPEICFGLRSIPDRRRLTDCIEWMAHSIEIVQLTLADATTDNGLHGRLIVGAPVAVPEDLQARLPAVQAELYRGLELADRGVAANALGSPLAALAYLIEVLGKQPHAPALCAGEIVSTGTITDVHPVAAGETWSTRISGLPLPGPPVGFGGNRSKGSPGGG